LAKANKVLEQGDGVVVVTFAANMRMNGRPSVRDYRHEGLETAEGFHGDVTENESQRPGVEGGRFPARVEVIVFFVILDALDEKHGFESVLSNSVHEAELEILEPGAEQLAVSGRDSFLVFQKDELLDVQEGLDEVFEVLELSRENEVFEEAGVELDFAVEARLVGVDGVLDDLIARAPPELEGHHCLDKIWVSKI